MATARERDNNSSPRSSSGGAESFKSTPDTRLTAFSPEDASTKSSKHLQDLTSSRSTVPQVSLPVSSYRSSASHQDKDPFITPCHQNATRLSPTASSFCPFTGNVNVLSEGSGPVASVLSTDLGLTRQLDIRASVPLTVSEVNAWLNELEAHGGPLHGTRFFNTSDGRVCVHFSDIRDACSVYANIPLTEKGWEVEYSDPGRWMVKGQAVCHESAACRSSQIFVFASVPPGAAIDVSRSADIVQRLLQVHGRLFAFIRRSTFPNGSFRAVAEFCDASAVVPALSSCNNRYTPEGIRLVVSPYTPESTPISDLTDALSGLSLTSTREGLDQQQRINSASVTRSMAPSDMRVHPPFGMYPVMFQSPFTSGMPYVLESLSPSGTQGAVTPMAPMSPPYSVVGSLYHTPPSPALTSQNSFSPSRSLAGFRSHDARRQNAMRVNRSTYHNVATHHNHVDINRIREGIDVRTTIMLRNIPNKVDQAMLKRIIDDSSWGKYDFMYLRIDFANDCNVGYAFINFVDPLDIIDFVDARGNQRWNCFKSDKVAEISYATIQGKDCLVQKFRNSSVMLEAPHYRPKLFFTSNGPMPELAGQEEPFPEPDNQSKMKRSCENAEHVGLFTPNAGQHFRDEQRRRRSQYDRGTRLAALEEYDYEAAIQHLYGTITQ